ncbi:MAG TPA: UpxY family transcription antiterminator [Terriglobia bacterium]|jgi:transcription antitermination factor NusG|nr:UpxY family transcription antiterminator [Terriglobia bacterium]
MSQRPNEVTGRSYAEAGSNRDGAAVPHALITPATGLLQRPYESPRASLAARKARWYAAYTRSRHEKTVAHQLTSKGIETFLPLYETVRRWKNGDHRVQLPLFPGYAFARIELDDRLAVLKVPGVVRLVGFNGTPVPLEDAEVEGLREMLASGVRAVPHPYLTEGRRVRITAGPLAGREGILVRRKGAVRVVISIDLIQRSVLVDLDASELEPAG